MCGVTATIFVPGLSCAAGGSLDLYGQIGLLTLIGLITKNGILIVEFANWERDKRLPLYEAVFEAAKLLLMTTSAMFFGVLFWFWPAMLAPKPATPSAMCFWGGSLSGRF